MENSHLNQSQQLVSHLITQFWMVQVLSTVVKLGVVDLLDASGELSIQEIGQKIGSRGNGLCRPDRLYRMMRALTLLGIFEEVSSKNFRLGIHSLSLKSDGEGTLKDLLLMNCSKPHWDAWGNLSESINSEQCPFEKTHGVSFFKYMEVDSVFSCHFHKAMREVSKKNGRILAEIYPFQATDVIVDVGGGTGAVLEAILSVVPNARGILFDAYVPEQTSRGVTENPRIEHFNGDFRAEVPSGGTVYLLSNILHDWNDSDSGVILKNCRRAMSQNSRLLIIENILSEFPEQPNPMGMIMDLEMLVITQGKERTVREFELLLSETGLKRVQVLPTQEGMVILEAVPTGEQKC